jgi:hypothetical protein
MMALEAEKRVRIVRDVKAVGNAQIIVILSIRFVCIMLLGKEKVLFL